MRHISFLRREIRCLLVYTLSVWCCFLLICNSFEIELFFVCKIVPRWLNVGQLLCVCSINASFTILENFDGIFCVNSQKVSVTIFYFVRLFFCRGLNYVQSAFLFISTKLNFISFLAGKKGAIRTKSEPWRGQVSWHPSSSVKEWRWSTGYTRSTSSRPTRQVSNKMRHTCTYSMYVQ